jgi:hypothetical protein
VPSPALFPHACYHQKKTTAACLPGSEQHLTAQVPSHCCNVPCYVKTYVDKVPYGCFNQPSTQLARKRATQPPVQLAQQATACTPHLPVADLPSAVAVTLCSSTTGSLHSAQTQALTDATSKKPLQPSTVQAASAAEHTGRDHQLACLLMHRSQQLHCIHVSTRTTE